MAKQSSLRIKLVLLTTLILRIVAMRHEGVELRTMISIKEMLTSRDNLTSVFILCYFPNEEM